MGLTPEEEKIIDALVRETEMVKPVTNRQRKKTPRRFRKRLNDDELAKVLKDLHR